MALVLQLKPIVSLKMLVPVEEVQVHLLMQAEEVQVHLLIAGPQMRRRRRLLRLMRLPVPHRPLLLDRMRRRRQEQAELPSHILLVLLLGETNLIQRRGEIVVRPELKMADASKGIKYDKATTELLLRNKESE